MAVQRERRRPIVRIPQKARLDVHTEQLPSPLGG